MDNELDEFLDSLPPELRSKTLQVWGQKNGYSPPPKEVPKSFKKGDVARIITAYTVGILLTLVGVILCMSIIFVPIGVLFLLLGGMPLRYAVSAMINHRTISVDAVERGH